MKWIIGLDLRPSSQGAVDFATWIMRQTAGREQEQLVGVHVLEEEITELFRGLTPHDAAVKRAVELAHEVISDVGADDVVTDIQIVPGRGADVSLAAARVFHHADGLVIGRQAKRNEHPAVRLGKVARRLLRRLPSVVIVVPPDLRAEQLGDGPVVALTDLESESAVACRFARHMAGRWGRSLTILHVEAFPEGYGRQYLSSEHLDQVRRQRGEAASKKLQAWIERLNLPDTVDGKLRLGRVASCALETAQELRAPLLVCGSRRLDALERLFMTSMGSELAAAAPCPVAVVPPDWT